MNEKYKETLEKQLEILNKCSEEIYNQGVHFEDLPKMTEAMIKLVETLEGTKTI